MGGYTKDFRNLLTILKNREEKFAHVAAALRLVSILGKINMGLDQTGTKLNTRMGFRYQFFVPV